MKHFTHYFYHRHLHLRYTFNSHIFLIKMGIYSCITLYPVLFFPQLTYASDIKSHSVEAGIQLLNENLIDQAYEEFELASKNESQQILAFLELQKIHYQNQQWDRFFAYAFFYRMKLLGDEKNWTHSFHPRMFALEVLGLLKHCQWQAAHEVGQMGLKIAEKLKYSKTAELKHAMDFLPSLEKLKIDDLRAQRTTIPLSIQSTVRYWPFSHQNILAIEHPQSIRFKIESRCSK